MDENWFNLLFHESQSDGLTVFQDAAQLATELPRLCRSWLERNLEPDDATLKIYKRSSVETSLSQAKSHGAAIAPRMSRQILIAAQVLLESRNIDRAHIALYTERLRKAFERHAENPIKVLLRGQEAALKDFQESSRRASSKLIIRSVTPDPSEYAAEMRTAAIIRSLVNSRERSVRHVVCVPSKQEAVAFWRRLYVGSFVEARRNPGPGTPWERHAETGDLVGAVDTFLRYLDTRNLLQIWSIDWSVCLAPVALYDLGLPTFCGFVIFAAADGSIQPQAIPSHYLAGYSRLYDSLLASDFNRERVSWADLSSDLIQGYLDGIV